MTTSKCLLVQFMSFIHRLIAPPAELQVSGLVIHASGWLPRLTHRLWVRFVLTAEFIWKKGHIISLVILHFHQGQIIWITEQNNILMYWILLRCVPLVALCISNNSPKQDGDTPGQDRVLPPDRTGVFPDRSNLTTPTQGTSYAKGKMSLVVTQQYFLVFNYLMFFN